MNHSGKKILVVGGTSLAASDIVETAKKLGAYVIVADNVETSKAKEEANEAWNISTADVDRLVQLAREHKVQGVIAGVSEFNTLRQMEIAEQLGVPCYLTADLWEMCMNKQVFKQICEESNVPVARGYNEAVIVSEEFKDFPVIIKPVDGSAGEGISICRNAREVKEGLEKAKKSSGSGHCVIEKYYSGEEVTMFYIAQNGEISLMAMGERHVKHNQQGVIPLPVGYTFPSKYQGKYMSELNDRVIDMLKRIGMKDGVLFIQSLVCEEEFVFYEAGYRLNGCQEFRIIRNAENIDILELLINYALTGRMADDRLKDLINPDFLNPHCNITFLVRPGKIGTVEGIDEIKRLPGVIAVHQMLFSGDEISEKYKGTLHQVAVRVFAYAENKEELRDKMHEIVQKLSVTDIAGKNMLLDGFSMDMYQ